MKARLLLAAVVLASIAPFAARAVFLDEHIYLLLAKSALANPLFPADTPLLFFGVEYPNHAGHTHPPVGEYYLSGIFILLGRFSEVAFRLLYSLFPIAAILAFYALAKRFVREPLAVAVLLAVSPAFLVAAPTLMMDVPMLAFLLTGLAFYFDGKLLPASVSFVLAAGTGYTALVPIACLGLVMWISGRPWKEIACVAAAPAALLLWQLAMTIHFGELPLAQTTEYLFFRDVGVKPAVQIIREKGLSMILNGIAVLSFIGGVSIFPGCVRLRKARSWASALGLALLLSFIAPMPSMLYRLWFVILATCGLMMLAAFAGSAFAMIRRKDRNGGEAVLILWVPAVLLFFIVVGEMINARYVLLALPALFLVLFREASRAELAATIVPTALLSLALAHADARLANSYRNWVRQTVPALQQDGFRIHSAAESGLRFYLELAGAETLSRTNLRPAGGDLIVRSEMFRYGLAEEVEVVSTSLKRFTLEDRFPLRIFNPKAHAGFYDSRFGMAPYFLSWEPHDEIEIAQVHPLVRQFPQESTDPEVAPAWGPMGPVLMQSQSERMFTVRFPRNIEIQYELDEGTGYLEKTGEGLRLVKTGGTRIVWRRLRFMPSRLMETPQ